MKRVAIAVMVAMLGARVMHKLRVLKRDLQFVISHLYLIGGLGRGDLTFLKGSCQANS